MTHLHHAPKPTTEDAPAGVGALIRWPRRYDLLVGLALAGRGTRVRSEIADAAQLTAGQSVLDVGCGTGTLTLSLAGRVGPRGHTAGVDAATQMIQAAQQGAARAGLPVRYQVAAAQALPYRDGVFDAVTSSLMIHHLPSDDQPLAVREMVRVLRPGGRLVIAEFHPPAWSLGRYLTEHLLGHAMAGNRVDEILDLAVRAGLEDPQLRPTAVGWLGLITGGKTVANS